MQGYHSGSEDTYMAGGQLGTWCFHRCQCGRIAVPKYKGKFLLLVWKGANNQMPNSLLIDAIGCYIMPLTLDANSGLKGGIREDEILD